MVIKEYFLSSYKTKSFSGLYMIYYRLTLYEKKVVKCCYKLVQ